MADQVNIRNLSDPDLILRYKQSGNNKAIETLFHRYTHLVFGVCMKYLKNREDSRDATLEILESLLLKLKVHDISNFKSWIYSVAKNHCLMRLRKLKNHVELTDDIVESRQDVHLSYEPDKEEELKRLEEAIRNLNNEQRVCVELFYLKEKSYQEIMQETGFDFGQVKSFIQNGKRNLRIFLSKTHGEKAV